MRKFNWVCDQCGKIVRTNVAYLPLGWTRRTKLGNRKDYCSYACYVDSLTSEEKRMCGISER